MKQAMPPAEAKQAAASSDAKLLKDISPSDEADTSSAANNMITFWHKLQSSWNL